MAGHLGVKTPGDPATSSALGDALSSTSSSVAIKLRPARQVEKATSPHQYALRTKTAFRESVLRAPLTCLWEDDVGEVHFVPQSEGEGAGRPVDVSFSVCGNTPFWQQFEVVCERR